MSTVRPDRRRALLRALGAAAVVGAGAPGGAWGAPVRHDLHYTLAGGEVRRATVAWDPPAAPSVTGRSTLASVDGPEGIALGSDGGALVALRGGTVVRLAAGGGLIASANASVWITAPTLGRLALEPGNERAWAVGSLGGAGVVSRLALAPTLATGAAAQVNGQDVAVTDIAWTGGRVFYAARDPGAASGSIGELNPSAATTARLASGLPAALALAVDPRSGDLLLFGGTRVTQLAVAGGAPVVRSEIDLAGVAPGIDLVDGAVDAAGRIVAAGAGGQLVLIDASATGLVGAPGNAVAVTALDAGLRGIAPLSGPGSGPSGACLWDSGAFDGRTGQLSVATQWGGEAVTADDFYLPPGVHRVDRVTATVLTSAPVPKARLTIYDDCDGRPGAVVATAIATRLDPATPPAGPVAGLPVRSATFATPRLWLPGGRTYWASVAGVTSAGDEVWYWATAGGGVVAGVPGEFRLPGGDWRSVAELGCGCTDFVLRVEGARCDVLRDGGPPAPAAGPGPVAALSHAEPGVWDVRAAEPVVNRTCVDATLCHLRAVMYSNCSPFRGRFEVYAQDCGMPSGPPVLALAFTKVTDLGYDAVIDGRPRRAYLAEWGADGDGGPTLVAGRTYWVSPVGVGSGSAIQGSYAALASDCAGPACGARVGGAAGWSSYGGAGWTRLASPDGGPRALSLLVGVEDPTVGGSVGPGDSGARCAPDVNADGVVDILDVLDFLSGYFTGCP